jgi:hypothetical protein
MISEKPSIKLLDMNEYVKIIEECKNISIKKNRDYGCDTMLRFASKGLVVRMYDKVERLINLVWNNQAPNVSDEKIEDTAKDLINYAVYLVMMQRNKLVRK